MNKSTIKLKKTTEVKAATPAKKEPRPATKPKKDKAPKTWEEAVVKWQGGLQEAAPIQCIVFQLVAFAYSHKRPELMDMIPEEWQEKAVERYADIQFKKNK